MKKLIVIFLILSLGVFFNCSTPGKKSGGGGGGGSDNLSSAYSPNGTSIQQSFTDWATMQYDTDYMLSNNVWNASAAKGDHLQSIFTETLNGSPAFGWTWDWPATDTAVVSYPEVGYGYSPWNSADWAGTPAIPVQIGTKDITANFNITSSHTGSFDLAFDIWVTNPVMTPVQTDIKYEIMIWLDHSGFSPAGSKVDSASIGGINYDIWKGPMQSWSYIAYVARSKVLNGPLDISGIFNDMVNKGYISNSLYIASIELGNEAMAGSGIT